MVLKDGPPLTLCTICAFFYFAQRKCDMYWPARRGAVEKFGLIEVTSVREDVMASYTLRTFKIRHTRLKVAARTPKSMAAAAAASASLASERYVVQYQFTAWPDFGVPETALPLLSFVRRSSEANRDFDAPIVVHCR